MHDALLEVVQTEGLIWLILAAFVAGLGGLMVWKTALLGLRRGVPNVMANMIGARRFDPRAEVLFRRVAYIVIGLSAILGLPVWKG